MSPRSLEAISGAVNQPLKGAAGNCRPPQSNNMDDKSGNVNQRIFNSSNQSYLYKCKIF